MTPYKYQAEYDLYLRAFEAAKLATETYLNDNPGQWYPCGFAWVRIRPARGRFVDMCKDRDLGDLAYGGGYSIYNPSMNPTQWMDAKEAGAIHFARVLREAGLTVDVETRLD